MTKPKLSIDRLTLTLLLLALLYAGMYVYEQRQSEALYPNPVHQDGCSTYVAGQTQSHVVVCDAMPDVPPKLSSVGYVRLVNATHQHVCPPLANSWEECQLRIIRSE